ncbi:hypothetical protein OV320_2548, partial [Actinobacteria bacterium OV320]
FDPPPSAKAEYLRLLAEALHAVVQRLMQGGRVAEVGLPAREAVQVYRQAAGVSAGESVVELSAGLLSLSSWLADVPQPAEAVTAAQAAVDILHAIQPPPAAKAEYFSSLAEALHAVVQRLMQGGRVAEVGLPAREAVQVYRQAAGVSAGESVVELSAGLLSLSSWLADVPQPAEAVTAAQAAVDILHAIQPPPAAKAEYFSSLAEASHNLAKRLVQAGRPDEATHSTQEAAQAEQQAASLN